MECIFCNITIGKIPVRKVLESERSLAFLDAFPLSRGHSLVIPKHHFSKIQEMNKVDNSDLFESVRLLTHKIEKIFPACLIAIHNGKESGQEIPHVHVHIIPRKIQDGAGPVHSMFKKRVKFSERELDQMAKQIAEQKVETGRSL